MRHKANRQDLLATLREQLEARLNEDKELSIADEDQSKLGVPEILLRATGGETYAIEVATGSGEPHFGSVARIQGSIASREEVSHEKVTGLIITDSPLSGNLRAMTDQLGMRSINAAGMTPDALADAVVREIKAEPGA